MTEKSYNPFKMLGSYLGALVFILYPSIVAVGWDTTNVYLIHFSQVFSIFISGLFGFLIGWGIHSLIRRIRK